jgi:hypothetical protein
MELFDEAVEKTVTAMIYSREIKIPKEGELRKILQAVYDGGFHDGVECFAHYRDGTQYVGTTGTTLKGARKDIYSLWNHRKA